jgi:hypothetical protein
MSRLDINNIILTPNILSPLDSPLDSPSIINSTAEKNPLTQSVIEHKKLVEALEKAIIESSNEHITIESNVNVEPILPNDTKIIEFLKENKEIIEPIIKEQYIEIQPNAKAIENKQDTLEALEKPDDKNEKQTDRLFIIGSVLATGVLGFLTYSYFKKKE